MAIKYRKGKALAEKLQAEGKITKADEPDWWTSLKPGEKVSLKVGEGKAGEVIPLKIPTITKGDEGGSKTPFEGKAETSKVAQAVLGELEKHYKGKGDVPAVAKAKAAKAMKTASVELPEVKNAGKKNFKDVVANDVLEHGGKEYEVVAAGGTYLVLTSLGGSNKGKSQTIGKKAFETLFPDGAPVKAKAAAPKKIEKPNGSIVFDELKKGDEIYHGDVKYEVTAIGKGTATVKADGGMVETVMDKDKFTASFGNAAPTAPPPKPKKKATPKSEVPPAPKGTEVPKNEPGKKAFKDLAPGDVVMYEEAEYKVSLQGPGKIGLTSKSGLKKDISEKTFNSIFPDGAEVKPKAAAKEELKPQDLADALKAKTGEPKAPPTFEYDPDKAIQEIIDGTPDKSKAKLKHKYPSEAKTAAMQAAKDNNKAAGVIHHGPGDYEVAPSVIDIPDDANVIGFYSPAGKWTPVDPPKAKDENQFTTLSAAMVVAKQKAEAGKDVHILKKGEKDFLISTDPNAQGKLIGKFKPSGKFVSEEVVEVESSTDYIVAMTGDVVHDGQNVKVLKKMLNDEPVGTEKKKALGAAFAESLDDFEAQYNISFDEDDYPDAPIGPEDHPDYQKYNRIGYELGEGVIPDMWKVQVDGKPKPIGDVEKVVKKDPSPKNLGFAAGLQKYYDQKVAPGHKVTPEGLADKVGAPKKSGLPDGDSLTPTGETVGTHGAQIMTDANGKKYLWKPDDENAWQGDLDTAVNELHQKLGLPVPKMAKTTVNGKPGTVQEWVDGKPAFPSGNVDPAKLSVQETIELQQYHAVDWLIANHDAHPGQFIKTPDGHFVEIDTGQAFKHFGSDKLSPGYHPNAAYGEKPPIYNTLMKEKEFAFSPSGKKIGDFIDKIQAIPDSEFREMFNPYANQLWEEGKLKQMGYDTPAQFMDAVLERKKNLKKDLTKAYGYEVKEEAPNPYKINLPGPGMYADGNAIKSLLADYEQMDKSDPNSKLAAKAVAKAMGDFKAKHGVDFVPDKVSTATAQSPFVPDYPQYKAAIAAGFNPVSPGDSANGSWKPTGDLVSENGAYLYSGGSYTIINKQLREYGPTGGSNDATIKQMDREFAAAPPLTKNIVTTRKMNDNGPFPDYPPPMEAGAEFRAKGYSSTAKSPHTWSGNVVMEVRIPAGTRVLDLNHTTGSMHSHENEILLNRGTTYRIVSDSKSGSTRKIVVEVVDSGDPPGARRSVAEQSLKGK